VVRVREEHVLRERGLFTLRENCTVPTFLRGPPARRTIVISRCDGQRRYTSSEHSSYAMLKSCSPCAEFSKPSILLNSPLEPLECLLIPPSFSLSLSLSLSLLFSEYEIQVVIYRFIHMLRT